MTASAGTCVFIPAGVVHGFKNSGPGPARHLYDPWTFRHLEATGIGPGWQCWEVGGGGGSIAAWLAERCGQAGHVQVTDIDPRFLVESASLDHPHLEIKRHDISTAPLPAQTFDVIHARLFVLATLVFRSQTRLFGATSSTNNAPDRLIRNVIILCTFSSGSRCATRCRTLGHAIEGTIHCRLVRLHDIGDERRVEAQ